MSRAYSVSADALRALSAGGTNQIQCQRTRHGADQVLVAASIEFDDELKVPELERIVADIEARLRCARPELHLLFVKPQTAAEFAAAHERLFGRRPEDQPPGSS